MTPRSNKIPRKAGSGRPPGATSFSQVTLRDLNNIFSPDESIRVSRVWLEKEGLSRALKVCNELNDQEPPSISGVNETNEE